MLHSNFSEIRSSEIGLAGTLFLSSLELFRICCNVVDKSKWYSITKRAFKNDLESYLLWGNHYDPGAGWLDRLVTESSGEFRDGVLANIGNVCRVLCKSEYQSAPYMVSYSALT